MKVHIIIHESFEAPGAIEGWAKDRGHELSYTRLHENESLPETVDGFDFLVIMGGPQSPATTKEECPHFDADKELALIALAIDENKFVFGACLGAQMISMALGVGFERSPNREIGKFDITLTEEGTKHPFFSTLQKTFGVGHWHGDMPGLTEDSKVLATSEGCPRQIVQYSSRVYGFQSHLEFNPEVIEALIENSLDELEEYKDLPYIQSIDELRSNDYLEMNKILFNFLDHLTS
jgi:GMP synthase (glutamine-hydrolysing)